MASKKQIVEDALRRYPQFGSRTIAQFIVAHHPGVFTSKSRDTENDQVEVVREMLRYRRGNKGKISRPSKFEQSPMPRSWKRTIRPYKFNPGLWLIMADVHAPMHDPKPLEAAIAAGQMEKVDGICFMGDFQDCAALGYWTQQRRVFMEELDATLDLLDWIMAQFPKKTKYVYKIGNHESRLENYYRFNAPELAASPLASMDMLFGFDHRGIIPVEADQKMMFGKLPAFHGHEFKRLHLTVNPARGLFLKTHTFGIIAHCHRPSMHPGTDVNDKLLTTWSVGCLCDLHPHWNPYGNEWGWGFALINVEKNGDFEVVNRRVLPSGEVV